MLYSLLTHWGQVTHIRVGKLFIIGSDNGLSPGRRQAIILINAGILLIWTLGANVSEISRGIHTFPFKKMHLKMLSAKWQPFCLGLNVLIWRRVPADLRCHDPQVACHHHVGHSWHIPTWLHHQDGCRCRCQAISNHHADSTMLHLHKSRGTMIHLVIIWFVLRYTVCNTLHDTISAMHIFFHICDAYFIYTIISWWGLKRQDSWLDCLLYVMRYFSKIKK